MKTIGIEEYSLKSEEYLLVDVRTPSEFAEAHIHGAVSQPLDDLSAEGVRSQTQGKKVVFSCLSGARAQKAAERFGDEALVLEGSLQGWERKGLPVVRGTPKGLPLVRQVHLTVGVVNLAAALLALFVAPAWAWVVVLTGTGLFVAGATGFCGLGMVLARMPWNRVQPETSRATVEAT